MKERNPNKGQPQNNPQQPPKKPSDWDQNRKADQRRPGESQDRQRKDQNQEHGKY